jgi:hypothetical protein
MIVWLRVTRHTTQLSVIRVIAVTFNYQNYNTISHDQPNEAVEEYPP